MRKHVGMSRTDAQKTKNRMVMISVQGLQFMVVALCIILGVALGTAQANPTLGPNPPLQPAYATTLSTGVGALPGQVWHPTGVAVDSRGNVYISDHGSSRVQMLDVTTGTWTVWGLTDGTGNPIKGTSPGEFNWPQEIDVDSLGNIYIADQNNNRIQKRDVTSGTWTVWGSLVAGDTGTNPGEFNQPYGITADSAGNVYVSDSNNNRIQVRNAIGTWTIWGGLDRSSDPDKFNGPSGIAVDGAGNVYVSDGSNNRIQRRDALSVTWSALGSYGTATGLFYYPTGIAVDSAGNVYVADSGNNRIQRRDVNGMWTTWGSLGTLNDQFNQPEGVAVDSAGNVYVADRNNSRVQKFSQKNENIYKTVPDNTTLIFSKTDFTAVFSATTTADSMLKVRIDALPSHGTLRLAGYNVILNQEILAASLDTLTYTPDPDYIGTDSFLWNAADEVNYAPNPGAVGITITPVPKLRISSPSQAVTNTGPVTYTLTYTHADTVTLAPENVALNATSTVSVTDPVVVSGTGASTRTVTISGITGNGTLSISIAAGTARNVVGNTATAAGPSAAFTVDNIRPTVSMSTPSRNSTSASRIPMTVIFSEGVFNFTSSDVSVTNGTINMSSFSGSGTTYSFNVIPTANGQVTVNIAAGVAQDAAGNPNYAASPLTIQYSKTPGNK